MIIIRCPYCLEERYEDELFYGGEADIFRAADPATVSDEGWTGYLYLRTNPKGLHHEQWCCSAGCGQWFKVARHTVTHKVTEILPFETQFNYQSVDQQETKT
jgi:sarcosine oxidase subunit delta|tara:strand:- start:860 stop:1165 length:306 start_codon:yes stop_codon:yes gene_type:complete